MKKKLYVPTSTLNFNNILSSESISPKAFYELRGFGYSRWTEIPENGMDNVILLYEEPFAFLRPKMDLEDHPMLIEIETDVEFNCTNTKGVFYSAHTIYLDPWNSRFIFFSDEDFHTTISMSDNSLETKVVNLYRKKILVWKSLPSTHYPLVNVNVELDVNSIQKDVTINKMKGLLYGYYIGAILSTSKEWVGRYCQLAELGDLFSSIASSQDYSASKFQIERIDEILSEIQCENPATKGLDYFCKSKEDLKRLVAILMRNGWMCHEMFDSEEIMRSITGLDNGKFAFSWLQDEETKLTSKANSERTVVPIREEEIVVVDEKLKKLDYEYFYKSKDAEVFISWVNSVFSLEKYNGKVSTYMAELSDVITLKAKEVMGGEWENSTLKQQLNQIRHYVRGQKADLKWENPLISSVASVLKKGNDWESLLQFMRRKMIWDYRLSYAMYGVLHGYANLTRDFTDVFYELPNKQYVADVYREIYGQLFGDSAQLLGNISNGSSYVETSVQSQWQEKVSEAWIKMKRRKNKTELYQELLHALSCSNDLNTFIIGLAQEKYWSKATELQKKFKKELGMTGVKKQRKVDTNDLFAGVLDTFESNSSGNLAHQFLINDNEAWKIIEAYIPEKYKKRIKEDWDWFIGDIRKEPDSRSYYRKLNNRDNKRVIESFCSLKKGKAYYFPDELREKVRKILLDRYCG